MAKEKRIPVQIWQHGEYAVAAHRESGVNYFCVKKDSCFEKINTTKEVTVGDFTFKPGEKYKEFGYTIHTGALYILGRVSVENGEALRYYGCYENKTDMYLLFRKVFKSGRTAAKGAAEKGYKDIFFTWMALNGDELLVFTSSGAPRVIEMKKTKKK